LNKLIILFFAAFSTVVNTDKDEIIHITNIDDEYIGHLVWLKHPNNENGTPKKDINNPDKFLRDKEVLLSQMLFGLQYDSGKWKKGKIYSYTKVS
jgi:hypothetical protein